MQVDYERSVGLANNSFRALIMAAMRAANPVNLDKLISAWPGIWKEMYERYTMPGGQLATDDQSDEDTTVYLVSPFNRN